MGAIYPTPVLALPSMRRLAREISYAAFTENTLTSVSSCSALATKSPAPPQRLPKPSKTPYKRTMVSCGKGEPRAGSRARAPGSILPSRCHYGALAGL